MREIKDREEVAMMSASQEAFMLTGGNNQAGRFRKALLSKLNTRQKDFVMSHQSPEDAAPQLKAEEEEEEEARKSNSELGGTV